MISRARIRATLKPARPNLLIAAIIASLMIFSLHSPVGAKGLDVAMYKERGYGSAQKGLWGVKLRFNKKVFPSDLKSALKVTINNKKIPVGLADPKTGLTAETASRTFRVVPKDRKIRTDPIRLWVKAGLADSSGRWTLENHRTITFWPMNIVEVRNLKSFYKNKDDYGLRFRLSGRYGNSSAEELQRALRITPDVGPIEVEKRGYNQWIIKGDFKKGEEYVLNVKAEPIANGQAMLEAANIRFKGPGEESEIAFRSEKTVIELKGRQLLPILLTNVTKVRCSLTRIPPYLVPALIDAPETTGKNKNKGENTGDAELDRLKRKVTEFKPAGAAPESLTGEVIEDADVFFTQPRKANKPIGYSAPLSFRPDPDKGGAWLVSLKDLDGNFEKTVNKVIQITDLSISYKISADQLLVWITSIHEGLPVPSADIMLRTKGGKSLLLGKSDKDGVLVVKDGREVEDISQADKGKRGRLKLDLQKAQWIVAATADDSAAAKLDGNRLRPFSVKQSKDIKTPYQATSGYVFTERGVYRPGEKVHFKFMQRRYQKGEITAAQGEKVHIEISDPRAELHYSKDLDLNEFGSCHDTFQLERFFKTGTYLIRVEYRPKNGEKRSWTGNFLVAEYKRPRHFVEMSMERITGPAEDYVGLEMQEDSLKVTVEGKYYAGGPVKNANVRWKATLKPVTNNVEGFSDFHFGNKGKRSMFLESGEASLNENGVLDLSIPMDTRLLSGLYGIEVSATVLDIDGEPATTVETYNPKPKYLVGVSGHPEKVPRDHSETLKVIVVDRDGNRVESGEIITKVMKRTHYYTHKRDSLGNINYLWEEGWQRMVSSVSHIKDGVADVRVNFSGYEDYMIRCEYVHESGVYVSQTTFDIGWNSYESWISEKKRKGFPTTDAIFVSMPSEDYRIGDRVNIEFETKRPVQKCLISIEGRDLLEYRVIDVKGKKGSFGFKVKPEHAPNAFVSIIGAAGRGHYPVYRVQTDKDVPTVYFGYAKFKAKKRLPKLKVTIDADGEELKGRPGESKKLSFRVTDRNERGVKSELTVCVVDEAVLALTRFNVPNLSKLADFSIPLGVFSGDLRLNLISQDLYRIFSTTPLTGGGAGAGRMMSTIRKDFRPVAYFNPALVTDDNGSAEVEFKLPDTTTEYRVYVVAADKGSGFASNRWSMVVNKEFFIEPALTRFLIPGDKLTFPLALHNRTDQKGDALLEAESSENLKLTLKSPSTEVPPWQSKSSWVHGELAGGAKALFRFKGVMTTDEGSFGDIIEKTIPVESKYLPIHRSIFGSFSKEKNIIPKFQKGVSASDYKALHPADFSATLTLSLSNWNRIAPGLKYLLRYPYGCVEQTSSGLIPLAALRSLVKQGKIPGLEISATDKYIESGVNRLLSMQTDSGGFSYWPGDLNPSWWGSMYATAALTLLKQEGAYDIPESRLQMALNYLRQGLFNDDSRDRYHGGKWIRELALYNLAMNGELRADELEKTLGDYDNLSQQGKAFVILAASNIKKGDESKAPLLDKATLKRLLRELRPDIKTPAKTGRRNSTYRTVAIALLAGSQTDPDNKRLDEWAGYLMRSLKSDGRWGSTVDTGWCLLALSRYFRTRDSDDQDSLMCKVTIPGEEDREIRVSHAAAHLELDPQKLTGGAPIKVSSDKKGLVHYTLNLKYPDLANDPADLKQGFTLRKKVENLNGKDEIRVGDIVRVTLDFEIDRSFHGNNGRVEYIALEDPVPAGITPINTDLKTEGVDEDEAEQPRTSWRDPRNFITNHSEFKDDGVRVFKDRAWPGFYRYSYLARAVAQGDFWMRGSRISLMYDPDSFGKTLGKRIKILPSR